MCLYQLFLKGCFLGSILFLFIQCNSSVSQQKTKVNPRDCEWHAVQQTEEEDDANEVNQLGVYCFRLYPDNSYTLCAELLFEQGKWVFDEEKKLLVLSVAGKNGVDSTRYIADRTLSNGKMQFSFYHEYPVSRSEPDEVIVMEATANLSEFDPYSKANNSWRVKPPAAELPAAIKKRTVSYLNFLLTMFQHHQKNKIEEGRQSWYPQPVQFYTNTVKMAYNNELVDWYNCFYNDEQGIEAYKLISGALQRVKITGDTDVDRNINCVEQLLALMNK
jgi:hypothetical protein